MKILIAGSDLNAKLLASYLKLENNMHDIYVTTDEKSLDNLYTCIDIKENNVPAICDFVKYNQIEFTIATSSIAIINGIADEFRKEGFPIFAPFSESERITYFNSIAKKIMYKLKINTPKFGIFDRENLAVEYIRRTKFPIVVENDFTLLSRESYIYKSFAKAKLGIQKIFENNNDKIVIESYIDTDPQYLYFITDGYNALPLISTSRISGKNYTTTIAPSLKISDSMIRNIMQRAIYPLLDDISKYTDMYVGIIGIKFKIYKNNFFIHEFYNGFQYYDFQAFLSLLNDNLLNILYDTAMGCLSDNHDFVGLSDKISYTTAISKKEIENFNNEDEENFIVSEDKEKIIYTTTSSTLNKAQENMYDYLKTIVNKNLIESICCANKEKELKI